MPDRSRRAPCPAPTAWRSTTSCCELMRNSVRKGHTLERTPSRAVSLNDQPMTTVDDLRRKRVLYGTGRNHSKLYPAMRRVLKRSVGIFQAGVHYNVANN